VSPWADRDVRVTAQDGPQRTYEILYSSRIPADDLESVVEALRAEGIEPETSRMEYRSWGEDPIMIGLRIAAVWVAKTVVEAMVKPSAEAAGIEIRDSLVRAIGVLRHRLHDGGHYEVEVSVADRFVAYDVPADDQEDAAWSAMIADFELRPNVGGHRYWDGDRGWLTLDELG
jgi:hypothetical protein